MNILICIGRLYMGGIEKYAIDLALGLKDKGHNVSLLVFFRIVNEEKKILLQKSGIVIHELKCNSGRDLLLPFRFFKVIKKTKPEIIHFNILPLFAIIPLVLIRMNTVYTIHQMILNRFVSMLYNRYLTGIIAVSKAVVKKNSYNLNYFNRSEWQVIYHGVNSPQLKVGYNQVENVNLVMVCRLAKDKHPEDAIELLHYLNNNSEIRYNLIFVGAGDVDDDEFVNNIRKKVHQYKMNDLVSFVGWQENVYSYIADSHGMLILSDSESFGYSGMEALAHGVPIFSYHIYGGLHEFHIHGETGIVTDARDLIVLAKEIDKVFQQPTRWEFLSNIAFEKAKYFSIQRMVDETEKFYLQLSQEKQAKYI